MTKWFLRYSSNFIIILRKVLSFYLRQIRQSERKWKLNIISCNFMLYELIILYQTQLKCSRKTLHCMDSLISMALSSILIGKNASKHKYQLKNNQPQVERNIELYGQYKHPCYQLNIYYKLPIDKHHLWKRTFSPQKQLNRSQKARIQRLAVNFIKK